MANEAARFGVTIDKILDNYPSASRASITDTSSGVNRPALLRWADRAAGQLITRLASQRGITVTAALETEDNALWLSCQEATINYAVAMGLFVSQREELGREYMRLFSSAKAELAGDPDNDSASALPFVT